MIATRNAPSSPARSSSSRSPIRAVAYAQSASSSTDGNRIASSQVPSTRSVPAISHRGSGGL